MVKSRRCTSSAGSVENRTASGRRPSRVGAVTAKRRDLGCNTAPIDFIMHQNHAEVRAHSLRARKRLLNHVRSCRGRNVEVLRRASEQKIAHAAAREVRSVAQRVQTLCDRERGAVLRTMQASHMILMRSQRQRITAAARLYDGKGARRTDSRNRKLVRRDRRRGRAQRPRRLSNVVASQTRSTRTTAASFRSSPAANTCAPSCPSSVRRCTAPASAMNDLDAVAVTEGPGLAGALLVGITYAKALSLRPRPPADRGQPSRRPHPRRSDGGRGLSRSRRLRSSRSLSPAATRIFILRTAAATEPGAIATSAAPSTTPRARPTTRSPSSSACRYPGGPWIDALAAHGNPTAVPFSFAQIKQRPADGPREARARARLAPNDAALRLLLQRHQDRRPALRRAARHAPTHRRAGRVACRRSIHRQTERRDRTNRSPAPSRPGDAGSHRLLPGTRDRQPDANRRSPQRNTSAPQGLVVSGGVAANRELRQPTRRGSRPARPAGRLFLRSRSRPTTPP